MPVSKPWLICGSSLGGSPKLVVPSSPTYRNPRLKLTSISGLQFIEFGNDIKDLAQNLKDITSVVSNASRQLQQSPNEDGLWDLSSLAEIIGDYHRTLTDCQDILHENSQFSQNTNPLYNIQWNVLVQPRIDRLRSRLQFHNSKVSIAQGPGHLMLTSTDCNPHQATRTVSIAMRLARD